MTLSLFYVTLFCLRTKHVQTLEYNLFLLRYVIRVVRTLYIVIKLYSDLENPIWHKVVSDNDPRQIQIRNYWY